MLRQLPVNNKVLVGDGSIGRVDKVWQVALKYGN
jgi:hypothetical protein